MPSANSPTGSFHELCRKRGPAMLPSPKQCTKSAELDAMNKVLHACAGAPCHEFAMPGKRTTRL